MASPARCLGLLAKLLVVAALLCQMTATVAQPQVVPSNGARLPSSSGGYGGYGGYYAGYYNDGYSYGYGGYGYGYGGYYSAGGRASSSTATCTLGVKDVLTTSGASTLVSLLSAAGLDSAVYSPAAQLTIFAPSNATLAKYLADAGITDPSTIPTSQLRQLLSYHMVATPLRASMLLNMSPAPLATLLGTAPAGCSATLSVVRSGGNVVVRAGGSSAKVISADVPACLLGGNFQSVVHVVDTVLVPCPPAAATRASAIISEQQAGVIQSAPANLTVAKNSAAGRAGMVLAAATAAAVVLLA